jgi:hypothetical protein
MIVHCLSFGALWWLRPGDNELDHQKFTSRAAIFNTTGFRQGSRERRNWTVPGVVRLNAGTCREQRLQIGELPARRFETLGLERCGAQNRLLLRRSVKQSLPADMGLVRVDSDSVGRIAFDQDWRSPGVRVVAASAFRDRQQTLLLMPCPARITTEEATWRLEWKRLRESTPVLTRI